MPFDQWPETQPEEEEEEQEWDDAVLHGSDESVQHGGDHDGEASWGDESKIDKTPMEHVGDTPDVSQRDCFVSAIAQDESLGLTRAGASKVFDVIVQQMQDLGMELGLQEMVDQIFRFKVNTPQGGEQNQSMPSKGLTEAEKIEHMQEEWNSSDPSTEKPGSPWTSDFERETLEEKVSRVDPEDAMSRHNVARMHEIKNERAERKAAKKEKEAGSDLTWAPLTKRGMQDFIQHCSRGVAFPVEKLSPPSKTRETPPTIDHGSIKWAPITKAGLLTFMGTFASGQDEKVVKVHEMPFGDLVEFSVNLKSINDIPTDVPTEVQASIRYIKELVECWGLADYEDLEWWLDNGPMPQAYILCN